MLYIIIFVIAIIPFLILFKILKPLIYLLLFRFFKNKLKNRENEYRSEHKLRKENINQSPSWCKFFLPESESENDYLRKCEKEGMDSYTNIVTFCICCFIAISGFFYFQTILERRGKEINNLSVKQKQLMEVAKNLKSKLDFLNEQQIKEDLTQSEIRDILKKNKHKVQSYKYLLERYKKLDKESKRMEMDIKKRQSVKQTTSDIQQGFARMIILKSKYKNLTQEAKQLISKTNRLAYRNTASTVNQNQLHENQSRLETDYRNADAQSKRLLEESKYLLQEVGNLASKKELSLIDQNRILEKQNQLLRSQINLIEDSIKNRNNIIPEHSNEKMMNSSIERLIVEGKLTPIEQSRILEEIVQLTVELNNLREDFNKAVRTILNST